MKVQIKIFVHYLHLNQSIHTDENSFDLPGFEHLEHDKSMGKSMLQTVS